MTVTRTYRRDSRTDRQLARGELVMPVAELRYETEDYLDLDPDSFCAFLQWVARRADRPNVLIRGFD